ncbi:three component ABC system middle component [Spirosoma panaciterrae]|uniref:three component ABC system middle component n=1 Tax=Spirosoma panaciterrae TaxID=496058 RepID=UPI00038152AB|nr:three component ABC system middle component [Spirosoma panaciterrae]
MLSWSERPVEIANLFNPAFCALLLRQAITEYEKKGGKGLDYPLVFLMLPLILHKFSRELLPATTKTKLHTWLQDHQEVRVGLDQRISSLANYTKEAIIYGLQFKLLAFDETGALTAPKRRLPKFDAGDSEAASCFDKAAMLGRWFVNAGNTATLLSMWGIRL